MPTLLRSELEKAKKIDNLEVFTFEQLKATLAESYDEIQKSTNKEEEMAELAIEFKSFTPTVVWDDDTLKKSIMFVRPAQVEWDEPQGDDISKARHGKYLPTPENKKLGRVGMEYGSKKEEEASEKKESGEHKDDGYDKLSNSEKAQFHRVKMEEANKSNNGSKYNYHMAKRDEYKELAKKDELSKQESK